MLQDFLPYLYHYGWLLSTSVLLLLFYRLFLSRRHSYRFMRRYLLAIPVVCLLQLLAFAYHYYSASHESPIVMEVTRQEADHYIAEHPQTEVLLLEDKGQEPGVKSQEPGASNQYILDMPTTRISTHQILMWTGVGIGTVSGLLLLLVLVPLLQMQYKIRRMPSTRSEDGYRIVRSSQVNTPFSFCRTIFLPLQCTTSAESVFLKHEKAHITCAHYIDVWCIEVLVRLLWFNPVLWYVRKSLRDLHEYEADRCVLQSGEDLHTYQTLLLGEIGEECSVVANGFTKSFIRRRLLEMKETKPRLLGRGRKVATATWALLLCGAFAMYALPRKSSVVLQIKPNDARTLPVDTCLWVEGVDTCSTDVEEQEEEKLKDTDSLTTEIKVDSTEVYLDRIKTSEELPSEAKGENAEERPTHAEDGWPILYDLPTASASDKKSMTITHTDTETHLTFVRPCKSDDQLFRFGGPDSYIVDVATGIHYKARRSIPAEAWYYFHLRGKKNTNCKVTVVFPRLPETTDVIQLYQVTHHLQSGDYIEISKW